MDAMDMDTCVQWATILSPIIAVLIACVTVKKSAKDTAKKIEAIEKSTEQQLASLKKLGKLQAKITTLQMSKELWELNFLMDENSDIIKDLLEEKDDFLRCQHDVTLDKIWEEKEKEKALSLSRNAYRKERRSFRGLSGLLIKSRMN